MHGGQVVELFAFLAGMGWVIGFTIAKVSGRTTKSWWYILMPVVWALIALLLIIIQNYILPKRRHRHYF